MLKKCWNAFQWFAAYLLLAIVFAGLCPVVWYLPYLALLCVVVAAAPGLVHFFGKALVKWFEHSSERVQWREHFLTAARDVFGILFPLALAIATAIEIWIWYPFKPIADRAASFDHLIGLARHVGQRA
jgi:hypothetical protein